MVGKTKYTLDQVKIIVHDIMVGCLKSTLADIIKWIKKKVPARTHQLRDSLLRNLKSSRVARGKFLKVVLGTHLNYAKYVDKFTTNQVRHMGEVGYAYYYGFQGRMILNDPEAVGNFWILLQLYAKERLKHYLRIEILNKVAEGERRPFTTKMKVES